MVIKKIYDGSPIFLQNLMVSASGYLRYKRRYGGNFVGVFQEILERQNFDQHRMRDFQGRTLEKLFARGAKTPFWSKVFQDCGLKLNSGDPFSELAKLPILTKLNAREHAAEIRFDGHGEKIFTHSTSGTTGAGLVFPFTRSAERAQWATWWRYRQWHGIDRRTWCGYLAQNPVVPASQTVPPFGRVNIAGRQLIFSPDHLGPRTAKAYLSQLRAKKVPWLHGFPSNLSLLANLMLEQDLQPHDELRIITTGAENLTASQRDAISSAFRVPVREHYGMAEAAANISECEQGHLHIDEDFAFVELLPYDQNDGLYRVIGTNFINPAFPLFRYDVNDLVVSSSKHCTCGRIGRVVDSIDGRFEDYVVLPSGARIGRVDKLFRDMTNIREGQIYQPAVEKVTLRVVRSAHYSKDDEDTLLSRATERFGSNIDLSVSYVDAIERTANGKLRMVHSEVNQNV